MSAPASVKAAALDLALVDWRDVESGEATFDLYGAGDAQHESLWEWAEHWHRALGIAVTAVAAWLYGMGKPHRVALVQLDAAFWQNVRADRPASQRARVVTPSSALADAECVTIVRERMGRGGRCCTPPKASKTAVVSGFPAVSGRVLTGNTGDLRPASETAAVGVPEDKSTPTLQRLGTSGDHMRTVRCEQPTTADRSTEATPRRTETA